MFERNPHVRKFGLSVARLISWALFAGRGGSRNAFGSYISPKEFAVRSNPIPKNEISQLLTRFVPKRAYHQLIRVGSEFDGGYVILPMDWPNTYLLSGGISTNNDFEFQLAEMGTIGLEVDYSVSSPPKEHPNLDFIQMKITPKSDEDANETTVDEMFEKARLSAKKGCKFILKLDIEGHEWACFESAKHLSEFDQIIVEYHNLHKLAEANFRTLVHNVTEKIEITHSSVYLSANNCCGVSLLSGLPIPNVIEVTYAKNDSFRLGEKLGLGDLIPKNQGNYKERAVLSTSVFWEGLIK
jgi:hypothetical protein